MAEHTSSGEAPPRPSAADLRTFLIADVRGYTRFTQAYGDQAASEVVAQFATIVRDSLPEFGGELLELRGDEALCVFRSARQALHAALELQRRLRTTSGDHAVFPLGVGMGLDAGEVVPTEGGFRGRALNFAARLCAAAAGGEVLASEGLVHLAHPLQGVRFGSPRPLRLKGVAAPVRVVRVEPEVPLPPLPRPPRRRGPIIAAASICAVAVGAAVVLLVSSRGASSTAVPVRLSSIAVIDAGSGKVVADDPIPVGSSPAPLVFGDGALWTYNESRQTVIRIEPRTGRYVERGTGVVPTDLAVGGGFEWLADGIDNKLYRLDWTSGLAPTPVALPPSPVPTSFGQRPSISGQVTVYRDSVWATAQGVGWPQTVVSYDAASLDRTHLYRLSYITRQIGDIESGARGVWMENRISGPGSGKAALVPVTPTLGRPNYVSQGGYLQQGVAVARDGVWFAPGEGTGVSGRSVIHFDPANRTWVAVAAPAPVTAIAAGPAGVWAAATTPGALYQLNSQGTLRRVPLRGYVTGIAVGRTRVWALIQAEPVEQGAVQ